MPGQEEAKSGFKNESLRIYKENHKLRSPSALNVRNELTLAIISGGSALDRKRAPSIISTTTGAFNLLKKKVSRKCNEG